MNQDGQSIERYAYDEFGMPCVYRENKVSGLLSEVPSHLDLMDIKWMKQEDCILHRQEDMMPERVVS